MKYTGHSGNDDFTGTAQHDVFNLGSGGSDTASGAGGNDTFNMDGTLNAGDRINGGSGIDTVKLDGNYANLVFSGTTMRNVEKLVLFGGHDYALKTADATVADNTSLFVGAAALKHGDTLTFNGAAETNGSFNIIGGAGNDVLTGGAQNDTFDLSHGGNDTANGGGGEDNTFLLGASFTQGDHITGGTGLYNAIILNGDYSAGLLLKAHMVKDVENIQLQGAHNYAFTLDNSSLAAGQQLRVYDNVESSAKTLRINASELSQGSIFVVGGIGDDTITGGSAADILQGNSGADRLKGGAGADLYFYASAKDSTGQHFDTVTGFDFRADVFSQDVNVTGVDTEVRGGTLRAGADFNTDLASAMGAGQLAAGHAALFAPDSGHFKGDTFLVIDFNGHAGYQANHDLVVLLDHAVHLGSISTADFLFDD